MSPQYIRRRAAASVVAGLAVLGTAACGGGGSPAPTTSASPSSASPSSASATSASSSPSASATVSLAGEFPVVPGYAYAAAPDELAPAITAIQAAGITDAVEARSVRKNGQVVAFLLVARYSADYTRTLDALPPDKVLASVAKNSTSTIGGTYKESSGTAGGVRYVVLQGATVSATFAYLHGGTLVEVFGQSASGVTAFTQAYLAALPSA